MARRQPVACAKLATSALARAVEGVETKDLKSLVDDGKKQIGSGVVAIIGVTGDGKAGVVVGVTADLTSRFSAVRSGQDRLCYAWRQGRRRAARHGAGRRARRRQGRCLALTAIEQAIAGQESASQEPAGA